jgi:NAD(P)-dependent dehydrogenase (short-subunit alcohol dehydrogenase family)
LTLLSHKTILVTGASSGIGRQIAVEAAHKGANVILVSRSIEKLEETKGMMPLGNHLVYPFDLDKPENIEALIDEIYQKSGPIWGLVHSAGTELTMPLRNMNATRYESLFRVNVIAAFELARIISKKKYINPTGASFVFISSVMGKLGKEGKTAYCATKGAIISSVKAMALELASRNIRCNAILPGIVQTEMVQQMFETLPESSVNDIIKQHPLGLGTPQDVANLAVFLLSDKARWITGAEITIDGGYSAQ